MKVFAGIFYILILLSLNSCKRQEQEKQTDKQYQYFDLDGFFKKEILQFEKANPPVEKTVSRNHVTEKKTVNIISWTNELELFLASDINKPAWKDSYKIVKNGLETKYLATDPELRTRLVVIDSTNLGDIRCIRIRNRVSNILYSSVESLVYYPDSLYRVTKDQKVRIIGSNHYQISGRLKN